jgi:hypothetical protein
MHVYCRLAPVIAGLFMGNGAIAADFDGSKPLLCASQRVLDLVSPEKIVSGLPGEMGAPKFMRIDFEKKTVTGMQRATPILFMDRNEKQILMQGTEMDLGWTMAVNGKDGSMTASMVDDGGAIVLFGACTPL